MSILIPAMRKRKLFNEVTVIYLLCVLSYVMLTGVVYQYYETISIDYYKPEKILLYLIYTGELLFIVLFSPIFALKQFTAIDEKVVKMHAINVHLKTRLSKQFFFEIILKSFILLSIFHIISSFLIYNNIYFSFQSSLMMLLVTFVFSLFIVAFTSFLIVLSRNVYFSIAVTYLTIITAFGCIFFVVLLIDQLDNPTPIINFSLDISPMIAVTSLLNLNLFRLGPFYKIINFEMFKHNYPHWSVHVVTYLTLTILFFIGIFLLNKFNKKNIKMQ